MVKDDRQDGKYLTILLLILSLKYCKYSLYVRKINWVVTCRTFRRKVIPTLYDHFPDKRARKCTVEYSEPLSPLFEQDARKAPSQADVSTKGATPSRPLLSLIASSFFSFCSEFGGDNI